MPIPTTITPADNQVIFEIEESVTGIFSKNKLSGFGTIVLLGASATTYSVGDIIYSRECDFFQESNYMYAATTEANILLTYTPPPLA